MQKVLTIFFADIANSTRLYQEEGDVLAHRLITDCLISLRQSVELHNGTLLRTVGDAVLASFHSSDDAMLAAIESQRLQKSSPLSVRIGFHAGEVIPDSGDVYGNAVNVAARVASFANANEIFTTADSVRELSPKLIEATTFFDKVDFKGIKEALAIYRVRWQEESAENPTEDTLIITAVNHRKHFRTDITMDLFIGAMRVRVGESNPRVCIGRDLDNDIIVEHESTSRHHAVIELVRGRYLFSDSSTNGSYLVRAGTNVVFVRRESTVLENDGLIGSGWHPANGDANAILYRTVRQTLPSSLDYS